MFVVIVGAGEQLINQVNFFLPVCSLKHSVWVRVSGATETVLKLGCNWAFSSSCTEEGQRAQGVPDLEDPAASGSKARVMAVFSQKC